LHGSDRARFPAAGNAGDFRIAEIVEVLREIGSPATLRGTAKLYAVDVVSPLFNLPMVDPQAALPREVSPRCPLVTTMWVVEANAAERTCRLRVVTSEPATDVQLPVQINGDGLGEGQPASTPRLFVEPYDQLSPGANRSRDFVVDGGRLVMGANEIVVLASAAITVTHIEMAVSD